MKLFTPHINKLKAFLKGAAEEYTKPGGGSRILAIDAFKSEKIDWRYYRDTLFNRSESNKRYVELYNESDLLKRKPIAFVQKDIDATYSLQKSFTVRHKTRLQIYRYDFANKAYRIPSSIDGTLCVVDGANGQVRGAT